MALSTAIASGVIVNADIKSDAAIADTKLATISTASKVSNSATTATNNNKARKPMLMREKSAFAVLRV